jgi:hypothetical protein
MKCASEALASEINVLEHEAGCTARIFIPTLHTFSGFGCGSQEQLYLISGTLLFSSVVRRYFFGSSSPSPELFSV